ncbi:MAG: hypothetical protein ABW168_12040 [Sedimenticola sp.]
MTEKRVAEASSLRHYFQEQWGLLMGLLDEQSRLRDERSANKERVEASIEAVVSGTDPRVRSASGYRKRLRGGAAALLRHIESLVDALPPALLISKATYLHNPQVSSLFANMDEVRQLCSDLFHLHDCPITDEHSRAEQVFFLLFLNYQEKSILGTQMVGEIIQREVHQTSIVFWGHRLLEPSLTEDEARRLLKQVLYENVTRYMRTRMTHLRHGQQGEVTGLIPPDQDIRNPEIYLSHILEYLELPQDLITIVANTVHINRMGIKVGEGNDHGGETIHLSELDIGEEPQKLVSIVAIPSEVLNSSR